MNHTGRSVGFWGAWLWACVSLAGCAASGDEQAVVAPTAIPPGSVAAVGAWTIPLSYMARHSSPKERLSQLLRDARLASESELRTPDRAAAVQRGVWARALIESLSTQALSGQVPSAEEEQSARGSLWEHIDRPRAVRTGYAYLPFQPLSRGDAEFAYMEEVAARVRGVVVPNTFGPAVQAVPAGKFELSLGQVPPLTADGRLVTQGIESDAVAVPPQPYAERASALNQVGETSGLVATQAGLFVIVALEVVDAYRVSVEEAQEMIAKAVAARRIAPELTALQETARRKALVSVKPGAVTLTRLVWRKD